MKALAVAGACVLVLIIAGAAYYATHRIPFIDHRTWAQAGYTDASGKFVKMGEFREADPDIFKTNGISHLAEYARMMVDPKTPGASLIVSSLKGDKAALFMRSGADVVVMENITLAPPSDADPEHGRKVRKLFKELGIKETRDMIHEYNVVKYAMEDLEYPIGHDQTFVTRTMERVLTELTAIGPNEGLSYKYERERPAAKQDPRVNEFILEGR